MKTIFPLVFVFGLLFSREQSNTKSHDAEVDMTSASGKASDSNSNTIQANSLKNAYFGETDMRTVEPNLV